MSSQSALINLYFQIFFYVFEFQNFFIGGSRSGRHLSKAGAGRPPDKKKDGRERHPRKLQTGQKTPYSQLSDEEKLLYHQQAARHSKGYMSAPPQGSQEDPPGEPKPKSQERSCQAEDR